MNKYVFLKSSLYKIACFFTAILLIFGVWLIAYRETGNDYLVPSVGSTCRQIGRLLADKAFWIAFENTALRALKAFVFSFFIALIFTVIAYLLPPFSKIISPIVSVLRALPTVAVLLIILVWTNPNKAPLLVAALALFPMLYTSMGAALSAVNRELIEMSKMYKVPVYRQIFRMYLPLSAPYILKESAAGISFALKLTVSAEVLANTYQSLGGLMQEAKLYLEIPSLFALAAVAVVAGLILEGVGIFAAYFAERRCK